MQLPFAFLLVFVGAEVYGDTGDFRPPAVPLIVFGPHISDTTWKQTPLTIAGGNGAGNQLNQLNCPEAIFIHDNQTIYIADYANHRIVEWKFNARNGQIVAGGNGSGNETNQLSRPTDVIVDQVNNSLIIADCGNGRVMQWPRQYNTDGQIIISDIDCRGLTMDKNGSLYVCDCVKHEVKRWKRGDQNGTIVAGGNGKGNQLNQLNSPTFIFIDEDDSLYVSDTGNHRVMRWIKDAKEGIIVAGGNGQGSSLVHLSSPRGVIVDHLGQIYVADFGNIRVMRWYREAKEGSTIVQRSQLTLLSNPTSLSFDQRGNLYVVDTAHRIQKFERNPKYLFK